MSKVITNLLAEGFDALNRNDITRAGQCCKQALDVDPQNPNAHFLVGLVALEAADRPNAHRAFKSVVKLDPNHAAAWSQLARLNASEGRVKLAEQALLETRRLKPTDPAVLDTIGTVLTQLGEYDAAKAFFARATTAAPNTPHYMMNLANNLVFLGEIDTAKAIFSDVIDIQPNTPQAHWGFSSAVKADSSAHIDQMRSLLARNENNPRGLGFLYYALGKELEDTKAWPEAFDAFAAGAAARRQTVAFDEPTEQVMFDALKATYTRDWLAQRAAGNPDASPIFVLGQPRTGTTLIERIITSHSRVHSAGELQQFGLAIRRLAKIQDPRALQSRTAGGGCRAQSGRAGYDVPAILDANAR